MSLRSRQRKRRRYMDRAVPRRFLMAFDERVVMRPSDWRALAKWMDRQNEETAKALA